MKIRAFNLHRLSFWYHQRLKGIFCFALREPDQTPAYRSSVNSRGFIFLLMTDHLSRERSGSAATWEDVWSAVYRQKLWSAVYRQKLTARALGSCYYITLWLWARAFIYLCLSSNPPATLPSPGCGDVSLLFINAPGSLEIAHPKIKLTAICSEGAEEGMCVRAGTKLCRQDPVATAGAQNVFNCSSRDLSYSLTASLCGGRTGKLCHHFADV